MKLWSAPFSLSIAIWAAVPGATSVATQDQDNTALIYARRETETSGNIHGDSADDVAIWTNREDPSRSLIIGTNKKLGLFIYGLDGRIRAHIDAGKVNNVDLRDGILIDGRPRTIVAVSDGNGQSAMIDLFLLDTETPNLISLGRVPGGSERAYGLCLYKQGGQLWAFSVFRSGAIEQVAIDLSTGQARGATARKLKLKSNAEGCVADDRTRKFYVAERDVGIWRWDADPDGSAEPTVIATTDKVRLVADVEGLAIAPDGKDDGYLIASSQGSDAYLVYRLVDHRFVGRFRIAGGEIDGTSHTDGIELAMGDLGSEFPGGLFIAQDDDNRPQPQNFKFVAWSDIIQSILKQRENPNLAGKLP